MPRHKRDDERVRHFASALRHGSPMEGEVLLIEALVAGVLTDLTEQ